jgi:hypothetical protein
LWDEEHGCRRIVQVLGFNFVFAKFISRKENGDYDILKDTGDCRTQTQNEDIKENWYRRAKDARHL